MGTWYASALPLRTSRVMRNAKKSRGPVNWRIVTFAAGMAWLLVAGMVLTIFLLQRPISAASTVADRISAISKRPDSRTAQSRPVSAVDQKADETKVVAQRPSAVAPWSLVLQKAAASAPRLPESEQGVSEDAMVLENFGTAVSFVNNPADAARTALKERKLLFVVHLSGNFEDAKFT